MPGYFTWTFQHSGLLIIQHQTIMNILIFYVSQKGIFFLLEVADNVNNEHILEWKSKCGGLKTCRMSLWLKKKLLLDKIFFLPLAHFETSN